MGMLKRTENGYFTLLPMALGEEREGLCGKCGTCDCAIRLIARKLEVNRANAIVSIKSCLSYTPAFDFKDVSGMEAQFNTFRVGLAWMQRLKVGDVVALRGPEGIFGRASVTALHSGPFMEMDRLYGEDNHLAIQAAIEGKDFDMAKVLRGLYGPNRFDENRQTTVIYMERLRE